MKGRNIPRIGEIYRHFKNNLYQIVAVAEHSETGEGLVIYQALYDDFKTYARPLPMFLSEVDHEKYPTVTQKYLFELVKRKEDGSLDIVKERRAQVSSLFPSKAKESFENREKEKLDVSKIVTEAAMLHQQQENQAMKQERLREDRENATKMTEGISKKDNGMSGSSEGEINPFLLEFLDTDTFSEKLQVLVSLRSRLDDRLIDDMATAIDVTVDEGPLPQRYEGLKTCLETLMKFEVERLR